MSNLTVLDHLFFVIIGIALPVLSLIRGKVEMNEMKIKAEDKRRFYFANAGVLWFGAGIVLMLWLVAGREFIELGLRLPHIDHIVIGLTALFIVAYLIETITELKKEGSSEEILKSAAFLPQNPRELMDFTFLAFSAGICEEVVYRGFLVNYLMTIIYDPIVAFNVAVIFPAIIFGVVHMYQGTKAVLKISIMSLLFSTIFIFSQSLLIVILLHIAVDVVGGFLGMSIAMEDNETRMEEEE